MASKQATSRLRKEMKVISEDPPPHIHVSVDEGNILNWSYILEGPLDTPYEGGWYWGRLKFPKDYPFRPPSILMVTPSGRFESNVRLCLSMSDYHPETWQPAWSVATVLKGLLSFMCEDIPTAGAVDPLPPKEKRIDIASKSIAWNQEQADFRKAFPEFDQILAEAYKAKAPASAPATAPLVSVSAEGRSDFVPGDIVVVRGLKARADLNGKEGVVQEPEDAQVASGRVKVCVDGEALGVKPENLERRS
ncbi:unnamed protein product, partial [Polarella glacialis]